VARLAGVILAVVFAVASVAKFRDPTGTRRSLALMGLPVPHLLAVGVPVVEVLTAILLIGGRAPEFLRHNTRLLKLVRAFDEQGKWIFSICHGIQILIAAGIAGGRRLTSYCNIRFEVEQAGAKWVNKQSVVDGNFITAQTWESHPDFYRDIFKQLRKG